MPTLLSHLSSWPSYLLIFHLHFQQRRHQHQQLSPSNNTHSILPPVPEVPHPSRQSIPNPTMSSSKDQSLCSPKPNTTDLTNSLPPSATPTSAQPLTLPTSNNQPVPPTSSQPLPSTQPAQPSPLTQNRSSFVPLPKSKIDASPMLNTSDGRPKSGDGTTSGNDGIINDAPPPPKQPERNPASPLGEYDWEELEARFHDRMEECEGVERGIEADFGELMDVCYSFPLILLLANQCQFSLYFLVLLD